MNVLETSRKSKPHIPNLGEYALWLKPTGDIYSRLSDLISYLSDRYSSPVFPPHVTLLGGLVGSEEEVLSRTSRLAAIISPFEIHLGRAEFLDEYFRSLFIRAKMTYDLVQANLKAREIFGLEKDPDYLPHLSLMYADLGSGTKEEIIADRVRDFELSFEVRSLDLTATKGPPQDWFLVNEFPLQGYT